MKLVQACLSAWEIRASQFDYREGPMKLVRYSSAGKVRKNRFNPPGRSYKAHEGLFECLECPKQPF